MVLLHTLHRGSSDSMGAETEQDLTRSSPGTAEANGGGGSPVTLATVLQRLHHGTLNPKTEPFLLRESQTIARFVEGRSDSCRSKNA